MERMRDTSQLTNSDHEDSVILDVRRYRIHQLGEDIGTSIRDHETDVGSGWDGLRGGGTGCRGGRVDGGRGDIGCGNYCELSKLYLELDRVRLFVSI